MGIGLSPKKLDLSFSEKLINLIESNGRKPADVYTKAGLTRAHFSKIKTDKGYHPTKETALAFAVALHLDMDEIADLLKRAGYSLSHSSESDLIVELVITEAEYGEKDKVCLGNGKRGKGTQS